MRLKSTPSLHCSVNLYSVSPVSIQCLFTVTKCIDKQSLNYIILQLVTFLPTVKVMTMLYSNNNKYRSVYLVENYN